MWNKPGKLLLPKLFVFDRFESSHRSYRRYASAYTGVDRELLTFTQVYPGGIAATAPHFNASEMARRQTCPQFSNKIPVGLKPDQRERSLF
eukprot:SAG11_NODE_1669_length_4489_cov_4.583371_5_plen_91_part_00